MALELHVSACEEHASTTCCASGRRRPSSVLQALRMTERALIVAEVWHVGVEVSFSASHTAGRFACTQRAASIIRALGVVLPVGMSLLYRFLMGAFAVQH